MVEIVVRVPENTPPGQAIYVAGDGPALGDWFPDRVALERRDDGIHRAQLDLPAGFHGRFLVTRGRWRDAESGAGGCELGTRELNITSAMAVDVAGWGRDSVRYHHDFASRFLPQTRTISVWLPPGYDLETERRFPVLYMQDGQNLFDPETAFAGKPWRADEVAEREVRAGRVRPLIIVGIANTVDRMLEYGPRQIDETGEGDRSRDYGRFVVEEVKPFIDATYRTLPGAENTGVGGSSMGGLISLHLGKWYPDVFGRCAALSPSLWWDREFFLRTMGESTDWLSQCRVWVDIGSREGATEAGMKAMSRRVRRLGNEFARRGLRAEQQFHCEEVEGGLHNEAAWSERFDRVLRFLFAAADQPNRPVM